MAALAPLCLQWDVEKISAAAEDLKRQLRDPSREMIGRQQVQDVGREVQESGDCQRDFRHAARCWA